MSARGWLSIDLDDFNTRVGHEYNPHDLLFGIEDISFSTSFVVTASKKKESLYSISFR